MEKKNKVLIIEDEKPLRQALEYKFKEEKNFDVKTAENGKAGLEAALEFHPDIILLDIIMPVMDGLSLLKELRKDEWGKSAAVMMLTNLSSNEEIEKAIEEGAYGYLVKTDWEIEEVVRKVKEKLSIKDV